MLNAFKDKSKKLKFDVLDDDSFDVASYKNDHDMKSKYFPSIIRDYVIEHLNNRVRVTFKIKSTSFDLSFMFNANSVEMIKSIELR